MNNANFALQIYHLHTLQYTIMPKKAVLPVLFLLLSLAGKAQTTYLPIGSDDYNILDRLETRSGRLCDSLRLSDKEESRKNAVNFLMMLRAKAADTADSTRTIFSRIDLYKLKQMISENGEWTPDENGFIKSKYKYPVIRSLYKTQYNGILVKTKDFFLVVNPVINMMTTVQQNTPTLSSSPSTLRFNSHDMEIRGWIGKKIGFYTMFTDNQEMVPSFVFNYGIKNYRRISLPGTGYFIPSIPKPNSTFNYLNFNGYIDFAAYKDRVNITFGSGRHFIGDGVNSLFLSDFAGNIPFLRLRTRIWKINYETLYLQLTTQFDKTKGDAIYNHKFATMHYVSYNAARWLNISFFESVVFHRQNVYELSYLNPIAFTIGFNGYNGGGDKSMLGFAAKAIVARHLQFYGQVMLNEFRTKEIFSNRGWYGNKWGIQAGAKYFDALGIKNLDLQGEFSAVRPYSYTAQDTLANYTNYNLPLADPLGAGFIRSIGILRYSPMKNLVISMRAMYYIQGVDTGNMNYGNNVFNAYVTAPKGSSTYGVRMINGPRSECQLTSMNISYQFKRNMFIDLGGAYRNYFNTVKAYPTIATNGYYTGPLTTTYVYLALRMNSPFRDYGLF